LAKSAESFGATIRVNSKVDDIVYDSTNNPVAVKLTNG